MQPMPAMPPVARKSAADIAAAVAAATAAAARVGGVKRSLEPTSAAQDAAELQGSEKRARGAHGESAAAAPAGGPVTLADAFGGDESEEEGEVR